MKHISPTFMYIIPMYLRLTPFTKTFPQMSFHLYFVAIFISLWGSTHDSADCWTGALTDPRLPATASNVCTTDARLGGVGRVPPPPPPNKNPGYAGVLLGGREGGCHKKYSVYAFNNVDNYGRPLMRVETVIRLAGQRLDEMFFFYVQCI